MALTNLSQITTSGISTLADINLNNITGVAATFTGNVTVGGTLTYDDVTNIDSVGLITARSGLSITGGQLTLPDAIVHSGNDNSKIRFPADDTITAETGGTEAVRITSGGKVGIGLTNPFGQLQVRAGTNANFSFSTGGGESSLEILNDAGSANVPLNVRASEYKIKIQGTEKVRITSAGLVGIGTDNPVGNLEVRDSKANLIVAKDGLTVKSNSDLATQYDLIQIGAGGALASYSTATATADTQLVHNAYRHSGGTQKYRYADTATRIVMNSPGGTFRFQNAASGSADADITFTERLRITSAGNVGINTSTFAANGTNFKVSDGTISRLALDKTGANARKFEIGNFGTGLNVYDVTADEERLRITSAGKVGIDNNNPNAKLEVKGSTGSTGLTFRGTDGSGNTNFWVQDGGRVGVHYYPFSINQDYSDSATPSSTYFYVHGSSPFIVKSDGKVGVGLTNPDQLIHINQAAGTTLFKASTQANSTIGFEIEKTGATTQSWRIVDGQTVNGALEFYDVTNSATRMIIRGGNVGINDSNPSAKLSVSGNLYVSADSFTGVNAGIFFSGFNDYSAGVYARNSGDDLVMNAGGGEKLRITSGGLVDVSGGIHVTENVTPTSGRGIEIFEAGTGVGQIQSYNRTSSGWDELRIKGSEVKIYTGTTNGLGLNLSSVQSTLYGTSDGILNLDSTNGSGSFMRFKQSGTSKTWVGCSEGIGTGGDQDDLGLRAVGDILLRAGDRKVAKFFTSGAVSFHVNSDSHETFRFTTQGSNEAKLIMKDASSNNDVVLNCGGLSYIKGGHLSIGTDSPPSSSELTVRGSNPELCLQADANYSSFIMMGDTNDYVDGYIEYDNYSASKGFKFITNNNHRMGLDSSGTLTVGASNYSFGSVGARISQASDSHFTRNNGNVIAIRRNSSDGQLIDFYRDGTNVGNITVSSGTVSLTGAHLSRWTQLPGNAERTEILMGTVLSNLDEMCEWTDEENIQLNRMKVSDVEGDKNVAGVFQNWDDDDDTYLNDFYCAMTGDFVIRIAQGVTVARGDLLMSAGDGTAKPQDDDIVRSKTIAKVTSTTVSTTYSDGSYCVPCVLMAC